MTPAVNGTIKESGNSGERVTAPIEAHPAVVAWMQVGGNHVPDQVDALRTKKKSQVFKLRGAGAEGETVVAKRCWAETATVERFVYENVLPAVRLQMPRFYGFLQDAEDQAWLFVEDIGDNFYDSRLEAHRMSLARWLAALHSVTITDAFASSLPDRGPNCYLGRMRIGRDMINANLNNPALDGDQRNTLRSVVDRCTVIESNWKDVVDFCARMPRTVIHGDLAYKHLRIRSLDSQAVFQTFDWEHAGIGLPGTDLQAVGSHWGDGEFEAYLAAFRDTYADLRAPDLMQMAEVGRLFQYLAAIRWAALRLTDEFVEKGMGQMAEYDRVLERTIADFQWNTRA